MSYYYEYRGTGEGDTTGLGGLDASRTFVVYIDEVGDDPISVVQHGGTEGQESGPEPNVGIAIGDPHPDQDRFPYAVAFDYIKEEQKAPKIWSIRIPYRLPSAATGPIDEWLLTWSMGLQTELMKRDLNGKYIGTYSYKPATKDTSTYDKYYAFGGSVALERLGEGRRRTGLPRTRPVSSFSLSRTLIHITAWQLAYVATFVNKVNQYKMWRLPSHSNYYMFAEELVKFAGIDFREEVAVAEGQTQSGLVFPVTLHYLVDFDGWTPRREYDAWVNDKGDESEVTSDDGGQNPVSDEFDLYDKADLHNIITALGGGSIRLLGGRG